MKRKAMLWVVAVLAAVTLAGCSTGSRIKALRGSGLLEDHSMLEIALREDIALLIHWDKDADWASYSKVLLDPVTIWRSPGNKVKISEADAQRLVNNFYRILFKEFSKYYEMADKPGPYTLRFQVVIAQIENGDADINTIRSVVPFTRASSKLESDPVNTAPRFSGVIALEGKNTDAVTGKTLSVAVDRRIDRRGIYKSWDSWNDVNDALAYWASLERYRICLYRGEAGCVKPEPVD